MKKVKQFGYIAASLAMASFSACQKDIVRDNDVSSLQNVMNDVLSINGPTSVYYPIADAYVQDGDHQNKNFGKSEFLVVKSDLRNYKRNTYIKFKSSVSLGNTIIIYNTFYSCLRWLC